MTDSKASCGHMGRMNVLYGGYKIRAATEFSVSSAVVIGRGVCLDEKLTELGSPSTKAFMSVPHH